ncbi:hypothetical protein PM032_14380 [Halorubrum ezzemoulense]|uniref:hypothetical protein n=1 Tax=Halorubrum ezzemoulense TaxID=337243 RepID=UPI00232DE1E7|nr:hypothetical protein [Halorubrum ezzemoulense]MDB2272196.1 hypothetical protein [Halorubrum ezzemoulense]
MDGTATPATQSRTLERTDIDELVPDRLADLEYEVFDELADFEHRGSRVEVERLLSYLGASIENSAILRGDRSDPIELFESEAITVALNALESKYPAWFGDEKALSELDAPVADNHLSKRDLKEAYFGEQLDPETEPVSGTDWADEKRVLIPLLALVFSRIRQLPTAEAVGLPVDSRSADT